MGRLVIFTNNEELFCVVYLNSMHLKTGHIIKLFLKRLECRNCSTQITWYSAISIKVPVLKQSIISIPKQMQQAAPSEAQSGGGAQARNE